MGRFASHGGHHRAGCERGQRHRRRHHRRRRKGLQRRLFRWFVAAILLTSAAVGGVLWLVGDSSWARHRTKLENLAVRRIERVWDDPLERAVMVRDLEETLGIGVELRDRDGAVLFPAEPCDGHPHAVTLAERGQAVLCMPAHEVSVWRFVLSVLVAMVVLMALSGALARRLGRPFRELAAFADRLGDGELDARLEPRRRDPEAALLARTLNQMAERIGKQLADQKQLLAEASHELRTPLGHARILVEMLPDAEAETRAELEAELEEMDRLVGRLLARSRLDFEALERRPLDAGELARQALERAGIAADRLEGASPAPTVDADPTLLLRALANLVENAERHGAGLDRLTVAPSEDGVRFTVADRGPGPTGPTTAGGLGLGLPLVERIAEAHGGSLALRPREGGGALATLLIAPDETDFVE